MFKKFLTFLAVLALILSLAACGGKDSKQDEQSTTASQSAKESKKAEQSEPEPEPSVSESVEESKKPEESAKPEESESEPSETEPPVPDPEPGIPAPEGWAKDVPTPVNGEILGGGWIQRIFYTADIVYKQADIDAYGKRLESFGFAKQEEHEYGEDWPDATVYSNGQWDVLVAEENDVFDYSYVNFYPLFDVVTEGYDGQPEGWPDAGDF